MTLDAPLPLALDILETVIPIIFVVLYTIAQLVGNREPKPQAKRPPRQRPDLPKPGQGAPGGQKRGNLEDALRREVDDFLRRASGQGDRQEQPQPKPQRAPLTQRGGSKPTPPKPAPKPARRPVVTRSEAQATEPVLRPIREGTVSEHVTRHIGASSTSMSEQTSHLGEEVGLADDRLEEHLREKFDHQLGSLGRQQAEPVAIEQEGALTAEIREMLSHPAGVRQFIIANEILNRPESRW